jgi:D-alanyl-lipoteichoic acid acyltransferase DltB (MBOAT superfamily)
MSVASLEFLVCLWIAAALFFHLPPGWPRRAVLAIGNVAFVGLLIPNVASAIALALFLLAGFLAGLLLQARPRGVTLAVTLTALVAFFIVVQKYSVLAWLGLGQAAAHSVSIVGLSYILFRQIHFAVDVMQGQIARPSLWAYVNYQLNLFALLAGPIQRYQDFEKYWKAPEPSVSDRHEVLQAHLRVLIGVIKIAAFGAVLLFARDKLWGQLLDIARSPQFSSRLSALFRFAVVFYAYPAYVYFNFSGYCDIVIGGASLLGQRLPENFDRPDLSRNIIDFWTRWHRTLGFWIRDYLFMPMYKLAVETTPRRASSLAFLCYFVAFLLAGIWHGTTSNYAVFGALHGAGASATKIWEMTIVRRAGRAGLRRYLESRPVRWIAILATGHFVCFSMIFFSADLRECVPILKMIGTALVPWSRAW